MVIYYKQRQADAKLEFIKAKLVAERKAYDELHAAAILYYYTLAKLETGKLRPDLVTKADDAMLAGCRYSAFIPKVDRDIWMCLWQAARALGEKAQHVVDPQQQKQLWEEDIKSISTPMEKFSNAVVDAHQRD